MLKQSGVMDKAVGGKAGAAEEQDLPPLTEAAGEMKVSATHSTVHPNPKQCRHLAEQAERRVLCGRRRRVWRGEHHVTRDAPGDVYWLRDALPREVGRAQRRDFTSGCFWLH